MEWQHDHVRIIDDPEAVDHPDVTSARKVLLATKDAHGMYAPLGFVPLPSPENLLGITRRPEDLYEP